MATSLTYRGLEARSARNLARVRSVIDLSRQIGLSRPGGLDGDPSEVLRAAVVFLHASLEDFLRTLTILRLPFATADFFSNRAFAGKTETKLSSIGELVTYRGKTVDEVLRESTETFLKKSNDNEVKEVTHLFATLGLNNDMLVKPHANLLESLMKRRHNIVHRFDEEATDNREVHHVAPIGRPTVESWIESVQTFIKGVIDHCIETGNA